jgi:hypothetical protein
MSNSWKLDGKCLNFDTNLFFETYEEDKLIAKQIDKLCVGCPVVKTCYKHGVSNKEYGVWGGVYLDGDGDWDREFNSHKSERDWTEIRFSLSMDWEEEVK